MYLSQSKKEMTCFEYVAIQAMVAVESSNHAKDETCMTVEEVAVRAVDLAEAFVKELGDRNY